MALAVRTQTEPQAHIRYLAVGVLCVAAVPLLAVPRMQWLGWSMLGMLGLLAAAQFRSRFSRHMLLLVTTIALLGLAPVNTDVSYRHMLGLGVVLIAVVIGPYHLSTNVWGERVIRFPFRAGRPWTRREFTYLAVAGIGSYLLLPYYLADTGSYRNWTAEPEPGQLGRLFIGTNALGIWDELFFVGVCLALFRQHLPFLPANLAQAALWTAFLYELGFRGWGPAVVFLFALTQGYVFRRSKSLLYVITVHLTVDFILYLALVHLNNPEHLRVFLTSPF